MEPASPPVVISSERRRAIAHLLVVRLSAMGDVLHTLPAVAALRLALPDTHFGWVVEERWADLLRHVFVDRDGARVPIVDQFHVTKFNSWRHSMWARETFRQVRAVIRELRSSNYDTAVDFQGAARSSLLARSSGAPHIYGFAEPRENVASMFYTTAVLAQGKHIIEQNLSLASAVAALPLKVGGFELSTSGIEKRFEVAQGEDYIIINPGAGWGAKQWPAERYGEVARRVNAQTGLRCFFNIGPGEEVLRAAVLERCQGAAEPVSCSTLELASAIRGARLFIGGDTGPMHLAAAMGIPVIAIFGPTDPARTGPFQTRSIVLRSRNSRTTMSHEPALDRGLLDISADDVVTAAIELLRENGE